MRLQKLIFVMFLVMLYSTPAFASDLVWERFMRNNHDVIAIGEIIDISAEYISINVNSTIVSSFEGRPQLKPELIRLRNMTDETAFEIGYIGNRDASLVIGDFVLVAADQSLDTQTFSGYMYKVDSLDKLSLSIQTHNNASLAFLMEVAMIEDFVHSDGRNTEFGTCITEDGKYKQAVRYRDATHSDAGSEVVFQYELIH